PGELESGGRPETLFGTGEERSSWRFPDGRIPEELAGIALVGASASKILLERVREIRDRLTEDSPEKKSEQSVRDRLQMDLGNLSERLDEANQLLELFGTPDPREGPPTARWVVAHRRGGVCGHLLEASPVWPGSLLERMLWRRVSAAVVTSATLSTLGSFSSFSSRSGLSTFPDVSYIALPSPFRLEQQGVLRIPPLISNPSDPVRHTEEVLQLLPDLLDPAGGSLVLFASRRQMEEIHRRLSREWKERILLQGERPRSEILDLHSRRIAAGLGSVLFGLASFSEGLDLKGDLCTHVIIVKIPFSVPTDPIEETLAEWIRSRGGDPFREISLPEAGLRLVQAAGRLIRSETDSGTVTILDRRLVDKSYGSLLIRTLPPFRRESSGAAIPISSRNREAAREDFRHDQ
ncbi:MAG: helicase C-terminal domain-containing protein, partial [Leptospirales bacterium]